MVVTSIVVGLLTLLAPSIEALRVSPGSPCTNVCAPATNTTSSEIVCLDAQYNTTAVGTKFQNCITCALQSNFQDTQTGETDVDWALYNLRYAFSSCVYDYPTSVTNVSTPCLVSCTPLGPALEFQLTNPTGNSLATFCGSSSFADNVVSTCEFCYSLTSQQAYLANLLEAVRYNCHFATAPGTTFAIQPSRIFNETALPSTTVAYSTTASAAAGSGGVQNLTIVIILPIIGFLILVALLSFCCFCLVRHRRKLAKKRQQSYALHDRWNYATINTPWGPGGDGAASYQSPGMTNSSSVGAGFHVIDPDGKQYEAGYSSMKGSGVVSSVTPVNPPPIVSVPSQTFHFDQQNSNTSPQGRALSKQQEELQQYQLYHLQQAQMYQQQYQQQQQEEGQEQGQEQQYRQYQQYQQQQQEEGQEQGQEQQYQQYQQYQQQQAQERAQELAQEQQYQQYQQYQQQQAQEQAQQQHFPTQQSPQPQIHFLPPPGTTPDAI